RYRLRARLASLSRRLAGGIHDGLHAAIPGPVRARPQQCAAAHAPRALRVSRIENRDAVIVGGGPAGSTLARALAAAGAAVTVLDKRSFPRDKPCAGWITPAVAQ